MPIKAGVNLKEMHNLEEKLCPRCGNGKLKSWSELTDDEKILVEKLPASAEFRKEERRRNRWCARCWHEFDMEKERTA